MPRDLGDVLDYFLPAAPTETDRGAGRADRPAPPLPRGAATRSRPAALPIVAIPIGPRDVVRAALAWNLAVEVARSGARASLLAPAEAGSSLLWPDSGPGPLGAEILFSPVQDLGALHRRACDVAVSRAADASEGGIVFVRVPPGWLSRAEEARALTRWCLLFATAEERDLQEAYALAKRVLRCDPEARVGLTIHGVRRVAEAERAFARVAGLAARRLGRRLHSYGLLVDDLHVYRGIVNRRPIGLEHPQSRAARALADVARLIREDARSFARA